MKRLPKSDTAWIGPLAGLRSVRFSDCTGRCVRWAKAGQRIDRLRLHQTVGVDEHRPPRADRDAGPQARTPWHSPCRDVRRRFAPPLPPPHAGPIRPSDRCSCRPPPARDRPRRTSERIAAERLFDHRLLIVGGNQHGRPGPHRALRGRSILSPQHGRHALHAERRDRQEHEDAQVIRIALTIVETRHQRKLLDSIMVRSMRPGARAAVATASGGPSHRRGASSAAPYRPATENRPSLRPRRWRRHQCVLYSSGPFPRSIRRMPDRRARLRPVQPKISPGESCASSGR